MHGTMGGYYEIRVTGPARAQYRLFCRLENGTAQELAERGFQEPQIAVITGMCKPVRTVFCDREHKTNVRGSEMSTWLRCRGASRHEPRVFHGCARGIVPWRSPMQRRRRADALPRSPSPPEVDALRRAYEVASALQRPDGAVSAQIDWHYTERRTMLAQARCTGICP